MNILIKIMPIFSWLNVKYKVELKLDIFAGYKGHL
jgi:hypothetical protein